MLWIGAWGFYGFAQWQATNHTYELTDPAGLKFRITVPAGVAAADVERFIRDADAIKKRQEDCANERGPRCEFAISLQMPSEPGFGLLLLDAIAGPVVVLILGLACFWVVSGFRRSAIKL